MGNAAVGRTGSPTTPLLHHSLSPYAVRRRPSGRRRTASDLDRAVYIGQSVAPGWSAWVLGPLSLGNMERVFAWPDLYHLA
ncbi:MAG: hypothetical protein K0Q72_2181 [Armatimonadetes bacterium]|nr:hypothetical protein [Armatimonadota bacterium]